MNLKDFERMDKPFLRAADIAPYLGVDAQDIRTQAQTEPLKLGFPVVVTGNRVRIPRLAFIHFNKYGHSIIETEAKQ